MSVTVWPSVSQDPGHVVQDLAPICGPDLIFNNESTDSTHFSYQLSQLMKKPYQITDTNQPTIDQSQANR